MANVQTSVTFVPQIKTWQVPPGPNNGLIPLGSVIWPGSVVVPTVLAADTAELAISFTMPPNYAVRIISLSLWLSVASQVTSQVDNWQDHGVMIINDADVVNNGAGINYRTMLDKVSPASTVTIAGAATSGEQYTPRNNSPWERIYGSPNSMVFRVINDGTSQSNPSTFQSMVAGLLYDRLQLEQWPMNTPVPVI